MNPHTNDFYLNFRSLQYSNQLSRRFFCQEKKSPFAFQWKKNPGEKNLSGFTENPEEGIIIISILRTVTEQSRITETHIHYS